MGRRRRAQSDPHRWAKLARGPMICEATPPGTPRPTWSANWRRCAPPRRRRGYDTRSALRELVQRAEFPAASPSASPASSWNPSQHWSDAKPAPMQAQNTHGLAVTARPSVPGQPWNARCGGARQRPAGVLGQVLLSCEPLGQGAADLPGWRPVRKLIRQFPAPVLRSGSDRTSSSHPSLLVASLGRRYAGQASHRGTASDHRLSRGWRAAGGAVAFGAERACCCSPAAPQTAVFAMASFERTSTSGALGSCGWGIAASANSAIAPGRKTRQWVEPPYWK